MTAVIEMALPTALGATIDHMSHEQLFGEDQSRYLLTCKPTEAAKIITQAHVAGIDVIRIGTVTAEAVLKSGEMEIQIAELKSAHEGWFPSYMAG